LEIELLVQSRSVNQAKVIVNTIKKEQNNDGIRRRNMTLLMATEMVTGSGGKKFQIWR